METQIADAMYAQTTSSRRARFGPHRWLAGIVALTLVIGLGTIACSQLGQPQNTPSVPVPAAGNWVQVLTGYTLTSLAAARSDPAVIYACAAKQPVSGLGAQSIPTYTLLRSGDFGAHWQNIGRKFAFDSSCEFAINPSDSNDVYAVAAPLNSQSSSILLHSTDGGQTWNTITPVYQIPGLQSGLLWSPLELRMEGSQLFGLQAVPPSAFALPGQPTPPQPASNFLVRRLVASVDGGNNWRQIVIPPPLALGKRWFVEADGSVFVDTGIAPLKATLSKGRLIHQGRAIPSPTPTPTPQGVPDIGENPVTASDTPMPTPTPISVASTVTVPGTPGAMPTPPPPAIIQVYNPTTGSWSTVPMPPASGTLLAVTPTGSNRGVAWFIGSNSNGLDIVYRNIL